MKTSNKIDEHDIAIEEYAPELNELYTERFNKLIVLISNVRDNNKIEIIKSEITNTIDSSENYYNDVDLLKYLASIRALIDLLQQGWFFTISNGKVILKFDNINDKQHIRYRLSAERNAQFKEESVAKFIRSMEKIKKYKGKNISISVLIADKQILINKIVNHQKVCEPYIQLVNDQRDELTGYRLSDIWRYFRYTWSIPYRTMPGRNMYYLVRDRLQPYHPIIGIFALGNSVLNLTVRDDDIGWTVDSIKTTMKRREKISYCNQIVGQTDGKEIRTKISVPLETEQEHITRITEYANNIYPLLLNNISNAINEIYVRDLGYHRQTRRPTQEQIDRLLRISKEYSEKSINNSINEKKPNWKQEAESNLYTRKRASELAKLLATRRIFNSVQGENNIERINNLLSTEDGRRAIQTALIANRKRKIGSNMMEIIVCGAIPPYNELLCGKLISILACSPQVISDYTRRYQDQVSEIASRMNGKRIIRDSHLVYLGTTSLYSVGSSQYNRIKDVPLTAQHDLRFREMGVTEGYGTVYFSKETTSLFSRILELQDGGKKIGHVFGEGTSPRFRMISKGFNSIGIRAEAFLKHYSPRIVYSINLAENTNNFLMGFDDVAEYGYDLSDDRVVKQKTQDMVDFWYNRWLSKRLVNVNICERLEAFDINNLLLGNISGGQL